MMNHLGPGRGQPGICLGCSLRPEKGSLEPCAGCGWPLCQQSCRQGSCQLPGPYSFCVP